MAQPQDRNRLRHQRKELEEEGNGVNFAEGFNTHVNYRE